MPAPIEFSEDWLCPSESIAALWRDPLVIAEDTSKGESVHRGASTLNQLVARLTSANNLDVEYAKIFFGTFRQFTSPAVLLTKLWQRFAMPTGDAGERVW